MTTFITHDNDTNQPLLIEWNGADETPAGSLIGRMAGFYPSKRIGPLLGTITNVTEEAYTIKVTSCEKRGSKNEIGKSWLCRKDTTAIMLF